MIEYEVITDPKHIGCVKELCNSLMTFQKSRATIHPEWFDAMNFESRFVPSFSKAKENFLIVAKESDKVVGYAYSNISPKRTYSGGFATLPPEGNLIFFVKIQRVFRC